MFDQGRWQLLLRRELFNPRQQCPAGFAGRLSGTRLLRARVQADEERYPISPTTRTIALVSFASSSGAIVKAGVR
jgi:hypothetical protein